MYYLDWLSQFCPAECQVHIVIQKITYWITECLGGQNLGRRSHFIARPLALDCSVRHWEIALGIGRQWRLYFFDCWFVL